MDTINEEMFAKQEYVAETEADIKKIASFLIRKATEEDCDIPLDLPLRNKKTDKERAAENISHPEDRLLFEDLNKKKILHN